MLDYFHELEALRQTWYWPIWLFITAVAVLYAPQFFRKPTSRSQEGPRDFRSHWSFGTIVPLIILGLFLGAYIAVNLAWEDFALYDNSQFTAYSLRGINFPPQIWPEGGRFFPLGLQEFNIVEHFTRTATGYHLFAAAEILVLACVLLILEDRISMAGRVSLVILALIAPSAVVSFLGLIYPERNILLLLASLVLFVKLFEQTRSTVWAVAAVLSSQVLLYLKEPVFLLLLGFVGARLLLRCRNFNTGEWELEHLGDEESRLDFCIAALSATFLAFYAFMMFPHTGAQYLADRHVSLSRTFRFYAEGDPLAWFFAAVTITRVYRILRGRRDPLLLWDGLACGGVIYFGAYLAMRMATSYFLAPVDLIAVLYLGNLMYSSWKDMWLGMRFVAAALVLIFVCRSLEQSAIRALQRKYLVRQKAAIARMILERSEREPGLVREIYFPLTSAYMLSEYAAYLSYRGVPVEEDGAKSLGRASIQIFGGKIAADGRCVSWRTFLCHTGPGDVGSLAVVLPDDIVLPPETEQFAGTEKQMQSYDPRIGATDVVVRMLRRMWGWGVKWQGY